MAKISDVEVPSFLMDDQGSDPSTPAAGFSRVYSKADGLYIIDDGGTVTGPFGESTLGSWQSFTPSLIAVSSNPTLGSGSTTTGQYTQIGDTVIGHGLIVFGSSGVNAGSGLYRVSLPSAVSSNYNTTLGSCGGGFVRDNSSTGNPQPITLRPDSADPDSCYMACAGLTTGINAGHDTPWTWAASDVISYYFMYQVD